MSLKDKIILGIDPGTTIMGFGLIKVNNQAMELIQLHELQLKKYNNHYLKLEKIFKYNSVIIACCISCLYFVWVEKWKLQ